MSGPKVSVYRVNRYVAGQMRCEQQSLVCATQIKDLLRSICASYSGIQQQIANVQLLIKRTSEGTEQVERLHELEEKVLKEVSEFQRELDTQMPHSSLRYEPSAAAYTKKQVELKRLQSLKAKVEKAKGELDAAFDQGKRTTSKIQASIVDDLSDPDTGAPSKPDPSFLQRDEGQNIQKIQESIIDDLSGVYSFDFEVQDEPVEKPFEARKAALHKELTMLLNDTSLSNELVAEVKRDVVSLQNIKESPYLTTFISVSINDLLRKIKVFRREQEEKKALFEETFSRYKVLCRMADDEAKAYSFSNEAISTVDAEIARLEAVLIRQQEQSYISQCVDVVMSDMGYDLIGSREVRKKSGKRFRNELFTFNDGTAVNVTFSPEGQISMELGGIAREDRVPTPEETEVLTSDMETFCGEFSEFERRLSEKGVIVGSRIALFPPSSEYAAIINVDDYVVVEGAQVAEMNVTEKRRKVTERKAMRRDD